MKDSTILLLLGGGALAWWLYDKNQSPASQNTASTPAIVPAGTAVTASLSQGNAILANQTTPAVITPVAVNTPVVPVVVLPVSVPVSTNVTQSLTPVNTTVMPVSTPPVNTPPFASGPATVLTTGNNSLWYKEVNKDYGQAAPPVQITGVKRMM